MSNDNQLTREQQIEKFKAMDEQFRMSATNKLFKIRNNPALFKPRYATGFEALDKELGGGFTPGLHCVGAISSLGKSTLVMQMAEHIARTTPVLIFSLEMKRIDLVAKNISRHTFTGLKTREDFRLAKTSDMLLTENIVSKFSDQEWNIIQRASDECDAFMQNTTVIEGGANPLSVLDITNYVTNWISIYNQIPVVIVDYLQILAAAEPRATDKQNVDYNLKFLKSLADSRNVPLILISSFNRENYNIPVSFRAFKDSGNLEYSCETVLGLQLKGVGESEFDADKAKAKYPREVELKILKQRYGQVGQTIDFEFYTRYNFFRELSCVGLDGWKKTGANDWIPFNEDNRAVKPAEQKRVAVRR